MALLEAVQSTACSYVSVLGYLAIQVHIRSERTTTAIDVFVSLNHLQSAMATKLLPLTQPRNSPFPSTYSIKPSCCCAPCIPPCYSWEVSFIVYWNIVSLMPSAFWLDISMEIDILCDVFCLGKAQRRLLIHAKRKWVHSLVLCSVAPLQVKPHAAPHPAAPSQQLCLIPQASWNKYLQPSASELVKEDNLVAVTLCALCAPMCPCVPGTLLSRSGKCTAQCPLLRTHMALHVHPLLPVMHKRSRTACKLVTMKSWRKLST